MLLQICCKKLSITTNMMQGSVLLRLAAILPQHRGYPIVRHFLRQAWCRHQSCCRLYHDAAICNVSAGDAGAKISVQYECSKPESTASTLTTIYLMQAPVLLRLVFHDAATYDVSAGNGGINASIQYEFGRPENTGLKRGWYESPACAVLCPHCMSTQGVLFTWPVPRRPSNCLP